METKEAVRVILNHIDELSRTESSRSVFAPEIKALQMLLERDQNMPVIGGSELPGKSLPLCPMCYAHLDNEYNGVSFCPHCGQALYWESWLRHRSEVIDQKK